MVRDGNTCVLNNFGNIEEHLRTFGRHKSFKSNYECHLCRKAFDSEDYLEFHMKQMHFRTDKLQ